MVYNAVPCIPVCTRRLLVRDDIIGGRLKLMVSFPSASTPGLPKSIDPALGPASCCLWSDIISCVSFSGSYNAPCTSSSRSDHAPCVTSCVTSLCSENDFYLSCTISCDVGCCSRSSSCTSSCKTPLFTTDSSPFDVTSKASFPTHHCQSCRAHRHTARFTFSRYLLSSRVAH